MNILLTGGCGYIGSHTAVALASKGHEVILLDDFSNSERSVADRIGQIVGRRPVVIEGDVRDLALLTQVFSTHSIDGVIHLAGLKAVAESVANPVQYYSANTNGALSLVRAMQAANVRSLVFSSSATVYGTPQYLPLDEQHPLSPENPYGKTKWHIEHILADVAASEHGWSILNLRYFNPVGAHESALIGEKPLGIPNNVMPVIVDVAKGRRAQLQVYGADYATRDGSAVRDYIHVMDLAQGHVAAVEKVTLNREATTPSSCDFINLGTGRGTTVLELIAAFEKAWGKKLPYQISHRRPGDVAECYAATDKALRVLHFKAARDMGVICESRVRVAGLA